jgi:hypothetical protein
MSRPRATLVFQSMPCDSAIPGKPLLPLSSLENDAESLLERCMDPPTHDIVTEPSINVTRDGQAKLMAMIHGCQPGINPRRLRQTEIGELRISHYLAIFTGSVRPCAPKSMSARIDLLYSSIFTIHRLPGGIKNVLSLLRHISLPATPAQAKKSPIVADRAVRLLGRNRRRDLAHP